jgi:chromosome segregation ATPase
MTTPTRETGGDTVNRLMDKFQAMGDQLTRLYPQTEAVEDEIESLHASVKATLAEQARLVAETAAANQRQQELRVQMEQARGDLIQTQGNVAHATRTKEAAQRRLQILKKHMAEQQQQFLQDSKDFQQTCQELQNEAAAVGLNVDACVFRASCVANGLPILENEELDAMVDTDDVNQDPLTWTNINTDERDAYLVMRNRAQSAQQALHEAHANKQVVLDRYAVRHAKQATLQQQLERLQGDIADKEAELAKVQQKTRNAKTLQRNLETCTFT